MVNKCVDVAFCWLCWKTGVFKRKDMFTIWLSFEVEIQSWYFYLQVQWRRFWKKMLQGSFTSILKLTQELKSWKVKLIQLLKIRYHFWRMKIWRSNFIYGVRKSGVRKSQVFHTKIVDLRLSWFRGKRSLSWDVQRMSVSIVRSIKIVWYVSTLGMC